MMFLYLIISSCFGDLIAFNRGINTIQKNNFQVLGGEHLKNTANSPNSLRILAELLRNDHLRTRLSSNKIKSLNSFFQNQIKMPKKKTNDIFLEITATVPSKDTKVHQKIGLRRKRNLLRKSFIRKWLVLMKFSYGTFYKWTLYRTTWNRFWNKSFKATSYFTFR